MSADEARTVRDLKAHQSVVLPMIETLGGRIIDTAGDGILAEFPSAVSAVECAVAIQGKMAERNAEVGSERRMQFRVGIDVGESGTISSLTTDAFFGFVLPKLAYKL
jgi:class 3 adenylate cyclase